MVNWWEQVPGFGLLILTLAMALIRRSVAKHEIGASVEVFPFNRSPEPTHPILYGCLLYILFGAMAIVGIFHWSSVSMVLACIVALVICLMLAAWFRHRQWEASLTKHIERFEFTETSLEYYSPDGVLAHQIALSDIERVENLMRSEGHQILQDDLNIRLIDGREIRFDIVPVDRRSIFIYQLRKRSGKEIRQNSGF